MNRSSDDFTPAVQQDEEATEPLGLLSFVRPPHPSFRWHSSSEGLARSLHLILCRTPSRCSGLSRSLSGPGSSDATVSLETLWSRPISRRFLPSVER
jgi:hypothetical protein